MSQILHCRLCPRDDDEVIVSVQTPLEDLVEHGITEHGLPRHAPWTREMIREREP